MLLLALFLLIIEASWGTGSFPSRCCSNFDAIWLSAVQLEIQVFVIFGRTAFSRHFMGFICTSTDGFMIVSLRFIERLSAWRNNNSSMVRVGHHHFFTWLVPYSILKFSHWTLLLAELVKNWDSLVAWRCDSLCFVLLLSCSAVASLLSSGYRILFYPLASPLWILLEQDFFVGGARL